MAQQSSRRSARQGNKRWEVDVAWLTLCLFRRLGLATEVILPSPSLKAKIASRQVDAEPWSGIADRH
jgi:stearoyl-CoA desaturase (delta-9 desaturase)